jgi:predicted nucleotidyltransferase
MKNLTPEMKAELFPRDLVLLGYRGSIAHNMYVPNSDPNSIDDVDLMGIFMAPAYCYLGIKSFKDTREKFVGKYDVVNYEYKKFVRLLLKSNPNVMSLLWLRPNHYLEVHPYGQILIDNKEIFVSKRAYKSFTGYAYSQLKKMTHMAYEGYMGEKRKALVDKFGYDCKNAAHCIRLLKMGMEFLTTGKLNVFREDAPWLLEIKRGMWTLEQVKEEAARLFNLADEAFIRSKLPNEPNYEKANSIVADVVYDYVHSVHIMEEPNGFK